MSLDYKKIIRSQKIRFTILKLLSCVPDKVMLSWQYKIKLGRKLNWKDPRRFTEFLQKYKTEYRNTSLWECVYKFPVKEYVRNKGLEHILPKLYGVYVSANQIPFHSLPDKFVLKTTNGSGGENIIICRDKTKLDIPDACARLNSWLKLKTIDAGREWAYTNTYTPKIIAEELLENTINPNAGIEDYKILCFNGKPYIIIYDCDRYIGHKRNFYDTDWTKLDIISDCPGKEENIPQPKNLQEMLEIATQLSAEFPFVRVDLYNIEGKIYFGELTFYPWSGYVSFNPDTFDFTLGKLFSEAWGSNV